jgi:prepilin-type N-terminal cleavage/methylation domain
MEKMTRTINELQMGKKPLSKKGFTLVEIIVVLVILAILAAILIPSMVGYIDKANKKTAVVEARSCVMAAQTICSENYKAGTTLALTAEVENTSGTKVAFSEAILDLAELSTPAAVTAITDTNGKVTSLTMNDSSGKYTVVYTKGSGYTVSNKTASTGN